MNQSLKNPCLECDHHLAGGDKNCDRCRDCEKRVQYINAIGKCPSSTMSEHVDLEGDGGFDMPAETQVSANDPVEKFIRQTCRTGNITVEKMRAGIKGCPDKKEEVNAVRDDIIRELASGKFGYFTQPQIGGFLNVSSHLVCQRMKLMCISPRPRNKKSKNKPPAPAQTIQSKNINKTLTLAFDNHPELFDDIIKLAQAELRDPDQQALWILLKVQERGLNLEKTGQNPQHNHSAS